MKVKKYVAASMQEAMKKIRSEMGNEAVILHSKVIQSGGFLGLFTKKKIEVIAALDQELQVPVQQKGKEEQPSFRELQSITSNGGFSSKEQSHPPISEDNNLQLAEQIKELKDMLQSRLTNEKSEFYPEPLKVILQKMTKQGINPTIKGQIMAELLAYWYQMNGNVTNNEVLDKEKELFAKKLKHIEFGGISYQKKYINVVGPTGVGKTTTLAKLAAECVLQKQKKVAFITTDTFRIAAIDQLKTYAKILNVPIEVCYSLDDFKEAKKKLEEYDFIFIDTAGRNFLESQYVKDIQSIIDFNEEMETFLVLAATAKAEDMIAIYERFSIIPIKRLIITKLDETSTRGSLIEVMLKTNKGIAYTTHGQDVPDDIEAGTRDRIIEQILR